MVAKCSYQIWRGFFLYTIIFGWECGIWVASLTLKRCKIVSTNFQSSKKSLKDQGCSKNWGCMIPRISCFSDRPNVCILYVCGVVLGAHSDLALACHQNDPLRSQLSRIFGPVYPLSTSPRGNSWKFLMWPPTLFCLITTNRAGVHPVTVRGAGSVLALC